MGRSDAISRIPPAPFHPYEPAGLQQRRTPAQMLGGLRPIGAQHGSAPAQQSTMEAVAVMLTRPPAVLKQGLNNAVLADRGRGTL